MGTLGKVLLFVNLLAAAGVAFFATQDFAKRQDVTATALKYHLMLAGLPTEPGEGTADEESVPFRTDLPDGTQTTTVRPKLLQNYFNGAEGGSQFSAGTDVVPSQVAEVERVEKKLKAQLDALPPAGQLATLCGQTILDPTTKRPTLNPQFPAYLVRLAESYDEREFVRQLGNPTSPDKIPASLATARKILDRKFAAVKAKPDPKAAEAEATSLKAAVDALKASGDRARTANQALAGVPLDDANRPEAQARADSTRVALITADRALKDTITDFGTAAARDEGDRKKRIAHLLIHLDASAAWQKRVGQVVGLRLYTVVLGEQVNRLRDMAMTAQQQKVLDQARFSEEYETIKTLAVQQSLLLERQQAVTADYAAQWAKDSDAVKNRHGQLLQREDALVSIKAQVNEALAKQSVAEADLFAVQKAVGETLRKNFDNEEKLEKAEQNAGGK